MSPFLRVSAFSPRQIIVSAAVLAAMAALVIWSMLLGATDIIAGLLDQTGSTPTRRQ